MKKETIGIIVSVLVVVSVVGTSFGYFVGVSQSEVVASDCGVTVCASLPEIPECPQCPDVNLTCPDCDDCRAWWDLTQPEDYTVWTFDNDTKILNITYYDNWYDIHKNLTFYNWTEIIEWMRFYTVPDFISARQGILFMFLATAWAYAEAMDYWP